MTTPYEAMASELMAAYEERLRQAAAVQAQLSAIAETATAERQAVRVTVGAQGELRGLEFPTGTYKRQAPAELTEAIMKTYEKARAQAQEAVRAVLAASRDHETDYLSLIGAEEAGDGDGLAVAGLRLPAAVADYLRGGPIPGRDSVL